MNCFGSYLVISGTVIGVCGLLLFSPYHTYFSTRCYTSSFSLMSLSGHPRPPPSSSSDEDESYQPVTKSAEGSKKSQNLLQTIKKEGVSVRRADPKYVDMKTFNALQVQVINMTTKLDNLRVELTAAQNEIAILKRSMPRVGLGPSSSFVFYPINK